MKHDKSVIKCGKTCVFYAQYIDNTNYSSTENILVSFSGNAI